MIGITGIEVLKKRKDRYRIFLEDGQTLTVPEEILLNRRLKAGVGIELDELRQCIHEAAFYEAYNSALRYLGYRARSCRELADYLKRKGHDPDIIEGVLDKLKDCGYLNDLDFAGKLIRDKRSGKPLGKRRLSYELAQKGVDADTARQAVEEISDEEELAAAYRLAEKTYIRYQQLDPLLLKAKVSRILAGRGFDWETVRRAMDRLKLPDPDLDA